jgi:hypothetical protein
VLDWLLHNLTKVAAVIFVVVSIVRSIRQAREGATTSPPPASGDLEQERRDREIREKIRRRISERQGGAPASASAPQSPPTLHVPATQDPWASSPLPATPLPPAPKPVSVAAEMERQQRLADELRRLQEAKALAARRAANLAAEQSAAAQTTVALRRNARDELLADLREPSSLRRAFVLREVLGPPAGLR